MINSIINFIWIEPNIYIFMVMAALTILVWIGSNIRTDYEGCGSAIRLTTACILAPWFIPVWIIKYRIGYWGDRPSYYKWFNFGKPKSKFIPISDRILDYLDKHLK